MEPTPSADEVRLRMEATRKHLQPEMDGIVSSARELTDWRYYVKSFPWGSLAAVSALGYMVVPRRLEIISPSEDELAKLAKSNRLVVNNKPKAESKPGLVETAFNLTGNMLLRAGIAYAGQQAGRFFGHEAAEATSDTPGGSGVKTL